MTENIDGEVLAYEPPVQVRINEKVFAQNLRSVPKGSSGALSGTRYEFLKLALDKPDCLSKLSRIAEYIARAQIPHDIANALCSGALTAIPKPAGGIRGIVAGEVMKRLVSKTLAKQFMSEFQRTCHSHQFGLNTRAGTDADLSRTSIPMLLCSLSTESELSIMLKDRVC